MNVFKVERSLPRLRVRGLEFTGTCYTNLDQAVSQSSFLDSQRSHSYVFFCFLDQNGHTRQPPNVGRIQFKSIRNTLVWIGFICQCSAQQKAAIPP